MGSRTAVVGPNGAGKAAGRAAASFAVLSCLCARVQVVLS